MAPNNQQQQAAVAAAAIRLPEFYADSPQVWFDCLDSTFATANITQSFTKFHWAVSRLPFSLMATVRLQLESIKDAQTALFLHKLPRRISNLINPWAFNTTEELIQRCNVLWMAQTPEEAASANAAAAAAAAVPSQQSPFRNSRRSPSPFRRKTPGGDKSGRHRSPTPGAAKGGRSESLCFYHSRFGNKAHKCEKGCSYQEN